MPRIPSRQYSKTKTRTMKTGDPFQMWDARLQKFPVPIIMQEAGLTEMFKRIFQFTADWEDPSIKGSAPELMFETARDKIRDMVRDAANDPEALLESVSKDLGTPSVGELSVVSDDDDVFIQQVGCKLREQAYEDAADMIIKQAARLKPGVLGTAGKMYAFPYMSTIDIVEAMNKIHDADEGLADDEQILVIYKFGPTTASVAVDALTADDIADFDKGVLRERENGERMTVVLVDPARVFAWNDALFMKLDGVARSAHKLVKSAFDYGVRVPTSVFVPHAVHDLEKAHAVAAAALIGHGAEMHRDGLEATMAREYAETPMFDIPTRDHYCPAPHGRLVPAEHADGGMHTFAPAKIVVVGRHINPSFGSDNIRDVMDHWGNGLKHSTNAFFDRVREVFKPVHDMDMYAIGRGLLRHDNNVKLVAYRPENGSMGAAFVGDEEYEKMNHLGTVRAYGPVGDSYHDMFMHVFEHPLTGLRAPFETHIRYDKDGAYTGMPGMVLTYDPKGREMYGTLAASCRMGKNGHYYAHEMNV